MSNKENIENIKNNIGNKLNKLQELVEFGVIKLSELIKNLPLVKTKEFLEIFDKYLKKN